VNLRHAQRVDLPTIVAIYNASIPGGLATADTAPVTVAEREPWFREFDPARRPIWVDCDSDSGMPRAWLSLRSFYGRPAYSATVEVAVYTAPDAVRQGRARALLAHALENAHSMEINTLLAFVFAHNGPSLALFRAASFERWGVLPRVAVVGGTERDLVILGRRVPGAAP
jgi:phosphinothricin acetyltransferase